LKNYRMFLLKKIISGILMPWPLAVLVLTLGLVLLWPLKKNRTGWTLTALSLLFLLLLGYGVLGDLMLAKLENQYPAPTDIESHKGIKWVVVLGGGMTSDPRLPITSQLSNGSAVRTIEGIRVYRLLEEVKLLLSGGPVFNPVPEGEGMAQLAISLGVPREDIATEILSMDTEDQARLISQVVGSDSIWLVTSAVHMPRSMGLFKKRGVNCLAAPTDYLYKKDQQFNPGKMFPNYGGLRKTENAWHEMVGIFYSRLRNTI
jgi:uncharacterized SAM-binding protein YcdF (DUF218 family)